MTKKKRTNEIIEKIKEDNIKPIPKWQGYLNNGLFWLAVILAVVLSALAFSAFLLTLFEIPLEIFREFRLSGYMRIVFQALPYFWLVLILVVMFLGLWAFQKTRHGYRYQILGVVGVGIVLMIFFGFILKQYQITQSFKNFSERPIPQGLRGGVFGRGCFIEDGLLGGEIVEIREELVHIKNPLGEKWKVIFNPNTVIKSQDGLNLNDKVLIIGEKDGVLLFKAFVVKEVGRNKLMGQGFHHN